MTAPETTNSSPEQIDEQLQVISEFINSRVAGIEPYNEGSEAEGNLVEVREAAPLSLANGGSIYCHSSKTIYGTEPEWANMHLINRGGSDSSLYIYSNDTFTFNSGDGKDNDFFDYPGMAKEEAYQNPDFINLVSELARAVKEEVPKPKLEYTSRALPNSIIYYEDSEHSESGMQVGVAEQQLHNGQDAALVDMSNGLFGVFDGVSEYPDSAYAARLAAATIQEFMVASGKVDDPATLETQLVSALENAHDMIEAWVRQTGERGTTTAVVAKIIPGAETNHLVWASAGDSRLYIKSAQGQLMQISEDEGEGRYMTNALGFGGSISKHGRLSLDKGAEVILVTDGITGDYESDILSDAEILNILRSSTSASQAATNLVAISRKQDDKMAVIVRL